MYSFVAIFLAYGTALSGDELTYISEINIDYAVSMDAVNQYLQFDTEINNSKYSSSELVEFIPSSSDSEVRLIIREQIDNNAAATTSICDQYSHTCRLYLRLCG